MASRGFSFKFLAFSASTGLLTGLLLRKCTYLMSVSMPEPHDQYYFDPNELPSRFPDYFEYSQKQYTSFNHPNKPPHKAVDMNSFWDKFSGSLKVLKNIQMVFLHEHVEQVRENIKNNEEVHEPLFQKMVTILQTHDAEENSPKNYQKLGDGAIVTAIDNSMGSHMTASLAGAACVTASLKVNFLKDIPKDSQHDYLIETNLERKMKNGKKTRAYDVKAEIKDKSGVVFAQGSAVFVRLPFLFSWVSLK